MNDNIADIILNGTTEPKFNLFNIKSANEWIEEAKNTPIPKMLYGELWLEGELCFLFADTNLGKSILAVQIANAISKKESESVFKAEARRQKVLYFDFELTAKQFEKRYSENYRNHYRFDDNFIRVEMDRGYIGAGDFEDELYKAMEQAINQQKAKILIVDNITFLKIQSTETAKEALSLMHMLVALKRKYGISILALAHTPKRNQYNPITINDLAGSKHLANFADSVFAIGLSHKSPNTRYIKQIKARATEIVYNSDYVIVCDIEKEVNFLRFALRGFQAEREHLKQVTDTELNELDARIIQLYEQDSTLSESEIARQLDTNHKKVGRVLKRNQLKE